MPSQPDVTMNLKFNGSADPRSSSTLPLPHNVLIQHGNPTDDSMGSPRSVMSFGQPRSQAGLCWLPRRTAEEPTGQVFFQPNGRLALGVVGEAGPAVKGAVLDDGDGLRATTMPPRMSLATLAVRWSIGQHAASEDDLAAFCPGHQVASRKPEHQWYARLATFRARANPLTSHPTQNRVGGP